MCVKIDFVDFILTGRTVIWYTQDMDNSEIDLRLEKGTQTRRKILDAAFSIIAADGISSLSASKIAKVAGISKSNVFHHFNAVDEIPFEVLNMICQGLFNPEVEVKPTGLEEYLMGLGEIFYRMGPEEETFMKTFYTYYQKAFYNEKYSRYMDKVVDDYIGNVKNNILAFCNKPFDEKEIDELGLLVAGAGDGLGIHSFFGPAEKKEKCFASWKLFVKMVLMFLKDKI